MNKGLTTILAWLGDEPVTPQDAAKKVQRALEAAEICTACFRPHRTYLCCEIAEINAEIERLDAAARR